MLLRARSDDDLGAIGAVVDRANECDGYPPHWLGPVESFLVTPGEHVEDIWDMHQAL